MWTYAQMSHETSMQGGPDAYLRRVQDISHSIGFAEGLEEGRLQGGVLGVAIGIAASVVGSGVVHLLNKRSAKKAKVKQSMEAEMKEADARVRFALEFGSDARIGEPLRSEGKM